MRHLIIPDTQCKPGVPLDHMRWIGKYIMHIRPDVVVHLGDGWDMESLSSYDKGKRAAEGRRYKADIDAGNEAWGMLTKPLRTTRSGYRPDCHFLLGNHEERIERATNLDPALYGTLGYHDLAVSDDPMWQVHGFLDPVKIDGVTYSHYFYNPNNGRPYAGTAATLLKTIGMSFTQGHRQIMDYANRPVGNTRHHGLVVGASYIHDETYRGPQSNSEWKGIVVKHEVENGDYDVMFVSLNFLCRKYEGVPLREFLRTKYPEMTGTLWR